MICRKCGVLLTKSNWHDCCKKIRSYVCIDCGRTLSNNYNHSEEGKARDKRRRMKHPKKVKARQIFNDAVTSGRIVKETCEFCGIEYKIEGHHHDYEQPLNVMWLCKICHRTLHEVMK